MAPRLIWIDEKEITGWGCADCAWMLTNRKNELDLPVGQVYVWSLLITIASSTRVSRSGTRMPPLLFAPSTHIAHHGDTQARSDHSFSCPCLSVWWKRLPLGRAQSAAEAFERRDDLR